MMDIDKILDYKNNMKLKGVENIKCKEDFVNSL